MQFRMFKQKLADAMTTNKVLGAVSLGLIVLAVMQQVKINSQHERLVLTPPHLTEEATVAWNSASQSYYNAFALYIVSQIASATPATVDYITQVMEPFFAAEIWQSLRPQLLAIKRNPNYAGINAVSNFTPIGGITYEPDTKKIFVTGKLISSAYSKGNMTPIGSVDAVYELQMKMVNGMPLVTSWYAYTGQPHTQQWAAKNPKLAEAEARNRQSQVVPMVPEQDIQFPNQQPAVPAAAPAPATALDAPPLGNNSNAPAVPGVELPVPAAPGAAGIAQDDKL